MAGAGFERRGYAVGGALVVLTHVVLSWTVAPSSPPVLQLFLPAVVAAAYVGGLWPGLTTTGVAAIVGGFLVTPWRPVSLGEPLEVVRVLAFLAVGLMISVLVEALHRARRRAETSHQRTLAADRRFMRAFYANPVAHSVSRLSDRCIVDVNDAYLRTFEVERADILGKAPHAAGITVEPSARDQFYKQLTEGGEIRNLEVDLPRKDGRTLTVLLTSQLVELDGEVYAMSMFIDITARRDAEREARTQAERFLQLAGAMRDAFWLRDPATSQFVYISPAYEQIFERSSAELYADPGAWMRAVHPEDRERIVAALPRQREGGYDEQFRILRPSGEVRWVRTKAFPVRGAGDAIVRVAGVSADITEQRRLEDQLRQAQKLDSVGQMAGGIAHDFNNLLNVIVANTDLLRDDLDSALHREMLEEIDAAVGRAASMTRQLLAFSRKQPSSGVVLDLNRVVEDTRRMLRRLVGADITIAVSLDPELQRIRCDPSQLVQILMNLALNARDAMPEGGTLRLETRAAGAHTILVVADSGCGMPADVVGRVFEPFFTTKEVGKGTGLGLAVVHGIVEQAGGAIELASEPARGTTFTLRFPSVAEPADLIASAESPQARGTERILLVDDDWHVRNAAARALRARGYTVHEAENGRSALRILDERAIDLLVTDVVMPQMDGRRLFEAAHRRRPELPVLFMSGYTDDEVVHRGVKAAELAFLEKPFRIHALAAKVRQVLDDKHP